MWTPCPQNGQESEPRFIPSWASNHRMLQTAAEIILKLPNPIKIDKELFTEKAV